MYIRYFLPTCSLIYIILTASAKEHLIDMYNPVALTEQSRQSLNAARLPSLPALNRTPGCRPDRNILKHSVPSWHKTGRFGLRRRVHWPCLSAEPPSYTADTASFPRGESTPPSSAMSRFPTWGARRRNTINQSTTLNSSWTSCHCQVTVVLLSGDCCAIVRWLLCYCPVIIGSCRGEDCDVVWLILCGGYCMVYI